MTYEEAVTLLVEESGVAHFPRCFEHGDCYVEVAARQAREVLRKRMLARRAAINEAEEVIIEHLEKYDREQIVPREASG